MSFISSNLQLHKETIPFCHTTHSTAYLITFHIMRFFVSSSKIRPLMFRANKTAARVVVKSSARLFSAAAAKSPVGFIGLGNMGGHMANNLLKKGNDLVIYDVVPAAIESVKAFGASVGRTVTVAKTPAEVSLAADTVVTMLPSSPHVKEVYGGASGLLSSLKARTAAGKAPLLLIDSSTIAPPVAVEVAAAAAAHPDGKAVMVDAPVSGGVGGAEAGTLTFMVGGEDAGFAAAKPVLEQMGKNIVHCGAAGTGQAAKVCNNLILGISMTGVSEAFNLAATLGLDAKVLAGIVNTSSGRCWSSDTYNPVPGVMPNVPASKGYAGGFGVDLMLKDINLALESAQASGAVLPMGTSAAHVYKTISAGGDGKKDFAFAFQHFQQQNKNKKN